MRSQSALDLTRLEPFDEFMTNPGVGNTSQTYELDEGYTYIITSVAVRLETAAAPGNRQLKLTFRDDGGNNITEHRTNYNHAASLTKDYFFNLNGPEVATPDGITDGAVYARMPFNVLAGGEGVQMNILIPVGGLDEISRFNIRGFRCKVDPRLDGRAG